MHRVRSAVVAIGLALTLCIGPSAAKVGKFVPWATTCHFGKYGTIKIDGMKRGSLKLIVNGKPYEVTGGGSYFFSTDEGPVIYFGPSQKWYEYNGVRDYKCSSVEGVEKVGGGSAGSR